MGEGVVVGVRSVQWCPQQLGHDIEQGEPFNSQTNTLC